MLKRFQWWLAKRLLYLALRIVPPGNAAMDLEDTLRDLCGRNDELGGDSKAYEEALANAYDSV